MSSSVTVTQSGGIEKEFWHFRQYQVEIRCQTSWLQPCLCFIKLKDMETVKLTMHGNKTKNYSVCLSTLVLYCNKREKSLNFFIDSAHVNSLW